MSGYTPQSASIDPPKLYADGDVPTEEATYTHEDGDYPEAGTEGLAVAGVTDEEGRLLVVVEPDAGHAVLPHAPVEDGDWAAVAREHVAASAGIEVELHGVELVRRVDHRIEGETRETTHHVLFAASRVGGEFEGLCETNDWEMRWCESVPDGVDDDSARADIERFL